MPFFFQRVFSYHPAKPRHPLLKLLLGVLGVLLLGVLVVVGLVVGLGMLLFAAARRLLRPRAAARPVPSPDVIEGDLTAVGKCDDECARVAKVERVERRVAGGVVERHRWRRRRGCVGRSGCDAASGQRRLEPGDRRRRGAMMVDE